MQPGKVIWITGLSGAGKTTVAGAVVDKVRSIGLPVVFMDGDEVRETLGGRWGYSPEERRELAYTYARLAKLVAAGGVHVVFATIAMFEAVRQWNRDNIPGYYEVYLRAPISVLRERDTKGLYAKYYNTDDAETVLSDKFELPKFSNIVLDNFGATDARASADSVFRGAFFPAEPSDLVNKSTRNVNVIRSEITKHWNSYYSKRLAPSQESDFARFCKDNYVKDGFRMLEFGCGNGRDTFYFAKTNPVLAIDASEVVVEKNNEYAKENGIANAKFQAGFFGEVIVEHDDAPMYVYSRFVLHAMDEAYETAALVNSFRILQSGGYFMAEFRTLNDPLSQAGVSISSNERVTDHYRRFLDASALCSKLTALGFEIVYSIESRGLAVHKTEDPVVARVVAKKP